MELEVRKVGDGYGVLLPQGSLLQLDKRDGVYQLKLADDEFTR